MVNSDGVIIAASRDQSRVLGQRFAVPLMTQAMESNKEQRSTFTDPFGELSVVVAVPLRASGARTGSGAVALLQPVARSRALAGQVRGFVIRSGLIAATVAVMVSLFLVQSLSRPIREVTEAAHRLAAGDLTQQVPVRSEDEVGKLADTFNFMAGRMQMLVSSLTEEQSRLSAVLSNVVDPLLAISGSGEIIFSNRTGERLLSGVQASAQYRTALVHEPIVEFVGRALTAQEPMVEPISLSESLHYVATSARFAHGDSGGVVVLLRDVSQEYQLNRLRRDFISSISHELRTPVTSIAGFLEALVDGMVENPAEQRRYLQIISDESRRLNRLIDDLFDYSRMESGQMSYYMEPVDYSALVNDVYGQVMPQGVALGIEVQMDITGGLPQIRGDRDRLRQVLLNLLNNALQFTPEGGFVAIHAHAVSEPADGSGKPCDLVVTSVSDSGTGISPDDLPHIFDRFYKSGKRQSGRAGGTGLGLAITRHIVEAHGGEVHADSVPGKGSTFTFTLPVSREEDEGEEDECWL